MRPRVDVSNRHIGPRLLYARGAIHGPRGRADLRSEDGVTASGLRAALQALLNGNGMSQAHFW